MPDSEGKLSDEETKTALENIGKHWKNRACPICASQAWMLDPHATRLESLRPQGKIVLGGPTYPLLTVTCSTCGFVHLFNAIRTGVVKLENRDFPPSIPTPAVQAEGSSGG